MRKIIVKIPTRIDLGGGTLDIWPIYILHKNSRTINVAIDLYVEISLIFHNFKECMIYLGKKKENFEIGNFHSLEHKGSFKLINHIINYFAPTFSFDLNIKISTPKGSGLGTSSSLAIGLCKIFQLANGINTSNEELLRLAMGLETQMLQLPTGTQDYLAAIEGGINSWHYDLLGYKKNKISINPRELIKHSLLCYIGKPHFSALSNWSVLRKRLEKNRKVIYCFEKIRDAVIKMEDALNQQNWDEIAESIRQEWKYRKNLLRYLETKEMKRAISIASKNGGIAAKGCGAAQGGAIYFLVEPKKKKRIERKLAEAGYLVLPFNINTSGLVYQIE